MKRRLTLSRETLSELGTDQLGEVAAAAGAPSGLSCPVVACTDISRLWMTCGCATGNC